MIRQRKIELLAPAKNLECGIAAVDHGADAIYIGAPRFGARAAAGNSLEDIAELVRYAHVYNVRIYVTVNTILKDEELKDTEKMIWDLYRAGVDALIVQDMGLLELNLPPIPLHASTQMDNRTSQKVRFLAEAGFRQVVLARELSLVEIENIHHACPDVPLEVFVHGALCVSYSGQCYVSQACFGRSANRGECAQFCRLAFDMIDADGKSIVRNKHLLSLKDLNQSEELEQLLDAGASSLKIEGRLKDVSYVKNVTAYYRQKLDTIFKRRKEYIRASSGEVKLEFKPQLDKSFSRGFTNYFLFDRNKDIFSFDTPKSLGEEMGVNLPGFRKGDRTDIELPAVQRELIKALCDAGKKVIFVNFSGSPIAMEPETKYCQAILQAWYPGQSGGKAAAEVLFGDYNPAGRLPVTFYRNIAQLPDFEDYNMTGRTYRYFKGDPLFPFGYGLSYTTFNYDNIKLDQTIKVGETAKMVIPVTNAGNRDGEEVVQVYLKKQEDAEGPAKTLRAFKRVQIPAGKTVNVELELTPKQLEWWDAQTNTMRTIAGNFDIMVGGNSKDAELQVKTLTLQ